MTFQADYPGAIVVEAANYGYATKNHPKGSVYHTPEEDADDDPQAPGYIAGTTRNASYTYFVSFLGFVFQLVPESEGAYANFVNGKPYPTWADPNVNLNLQCISISFEGHAATIHRTMVRGQSQWNAGVDLVAHRAKALSLSPDDWARHADVSVARSDPGSLDLITFTLDVKAKMEGDQMTPEERAELKRLIASEKSLSENVGSLNDAVKDLQAAVTTPEEHQEIVNARDNIRNLQQGGAGDSYTDDDARQAVKERL